MYIAKIKSYLDAINPDLLRTKCHSARNKVIRLLKNIEPKSLAIGISIVISFYALLFLYVFINATNTVKKLEDQLATETISVQFVKETKEIKTTKVMASVLVDGLQETTKLGKLPIIRPSDNLTSFRAYQHQFSFDKVDKPIISFILLDYGLSKEQSKYALDILPSEVSFLLSPYSYLPDEWVKMAQDKGHEVWIDVPIQNEKTKNSGKNTVFHHSSMIQKIKSMKRSLARAGGYVGIGSYTDNSMNAISEDYLKLMDELYARGLGYIEINPNAPKILEKKAFDMFTPYVRADLKIVRMKGRDNSFEKLEIIANKKGHAIAVIPSYPNTIKNLAVWILKIAQSDYTIAPISAIYDLPLQSKNTPKNLHKNDRTEPIENIHD